MWSTRKTLVQDPLPASGGSLAVEASLQSPHPIPPQISPFEKDTSHIGLGHTQLHYDLVSTRCIYNDPISKCGHILRYWVPHHMNFWRTQFNLKQLTVFTSDGYSLPLPLLWGEGMSTTFNTQANPICLSNCLLCWLRLVVCGGRAGSGPLKQMVQGDGDPLDWEYGILNIFCPLLWASATTLKQQAEPVPYPVNAYLVFLTKWWLLQDKILPTPTGIQSERPKCALQLPTVLWGQRDVKNDRSRAHTEDTVGSEEMAHLQLTWKMPSSIPNSGQKDTGSHLLAFTQTNDCCPFSRRIQEKDPRS